VVVEVEESVPAESSVAPRERDVLCFVGIAGMEVERQKERGAVGVPCLASRVPFCYGPIPG
jgi:hypothetical protein